MHTVNPLRNILLTYNSIFHQLRYQHILTFPFVCVLRNVSIFRTDENVVSRKTVLMSDGVDGCTEGTFGFLAAEVNGGVEDVQASGQQKMLRCIIQIEIVLVVWNSKL